MSGWRNSNATVVEGAVVHHQRSGLLLTTELSELVERVIVDGMGKIQVMMLASRRSMEEPDHVEVDSMNGSMSTPTFCRFISKLRGNCTALIRVVVLLEE